jgi:hypothetical protein
LRHADAWSSSLDCRNEHAQRNGCATQAGKRACKEQYSALNDRIGATVHVIVENQVALGDAFPAKAVLIRLMNEGLDRHEAIHAIGSVLSKKAP